ncbi:RNA polymerase sigma-70 factor [Phytoactinopolyspora limicola]|uniref:RNA polymerase sigma-70 factor n=1 Tax=Phytoactinopolyspora limicola TaxID=2715536 RepID=UPI0014095C55|nr:RNA polymerase sigma-70 factor [Phytoactinopolyspora limicola]
MTSAGRHPRRPWWATPATWLYREVIALQHDKLRPLMFSIAYRMLGSVAEAEDVVQEAFLRMHKSTVDGKRIESAEAFATTITTRLAIDALRSARVRRELYVGPWLPEPLLTSDDDPAHRLETDETVTTAFLILLESLSPVERAVFLLREVFGYTYEDIAEVVEKSVANCRQIMARARRAVTERQPRFEADRTHQVELSQRFLAAASGGDMTALHQLLTDDVEFVGDGGGRVPALGRPITGPTQVGRFVLGLLRQARRTDMRIELAEANGLAAWQAFAPDGGVLGVLTLATTGDRIGAFYNVINPDKLRHIGPVGDLVALTQGTTP